MDSIVDFNRNTIRTIPRWIRKEDWNSPPSLFNYGLPHRVLHLIDNDISNGITECDILCWFIRMFQSENKRVRYLEIGVSVGKTFTQIVKFLQNISSNYSAHCLDIEAINPTFKTILNNLNADAVSEKHIPVCLVTPSIRKENVNLITEWKFATNDIRYYEADEYDINIWKHMGEKYNIIFSDAMHEPQALLTEYSKLKENKLIDEDKFIYCFDDLEHSKSGKMWQAVLYIHADLKATFPDREIVLKHYRVNGWLGNNEYAHDFGVISSFNYVVPGVSEV